MPSRIFLRSPAIATVALPLLVASALASMFLACSGLKSSDAPADSGPGDAGDEAAVIVGDDGSVPDGGQADSAVPDAAPVDFECTTDPWTKTAKLKKECEPRQVKIVEVPAPIDVRGISIARTPAGRVGIVYNASQGADTDEMHLVHFTPSMPTYPPPKLVVRATGQFFHDGYATRIAAMAPDTLQILSYDMDDSTFIGELHLRKLVAGAEPLTDALVASAVKSPTELAFGSDLAGNTVAAYRVSTSATVAKLSTKKGTPAGVFTALPDLSTTLQPTVAPGVGGGSMFVDASGQVHFLYHYNDAAIAPQFTTPRYHTLAGTTWSDRKTIHNNAPDGLSGYSGSLAVFGTKKYAAIYFRKAGTTTADLLLVTWQADADVPTVEILDTQIPSPDPLVPAYRVAIAVDKFGLVHLAIVVPTDDEAGLGPKNGYLEYRRQTPQPGGGTKWLSDIVDPAVFTPAGQGSSAFVAMVVDENARPHIAYRSAADDSVRYATRFDR
jgi:hypothetical protein